MNFSGDGKMPTLKFTTLWDNHPGPGSMPCDVQFKDQCAIRMGASLLKSGVAMSTFTGVRCWSNLKHSPKHILRAEELANWLAKQKALVGTPSKRKKANSSHYQGKKGIVFIKDGWKGGGDHIDLWSGHAMRTGRTEWFELGWEVWFWPLD
ncbi:MAG TPA: type VI secretion system amidase effector protein Tae4 [Allosphingosinicella sp.]|jgi:hypothetical protein